MLDGQVLECPAFEIHLGDDTICVWADGRVEGDYIDGKSYIVINRIPQIVAMAVARGVRSKAA
jgi:hypothetical protein